MAVNRRGFLGLGLAAATTGLATVPVRAEDDGEGVERLKFLAFADLHYAPGVFPHDERAWLERILARAKRKRAEFVIHVGDFVHNPVKEAEFVNYYNDFELPTYHTLGNHDTEGCSYAETLKAYRLDEGHYYFDRGGFRFVVLDTNYFQKDGKFIHFEGGNYRDWTGLNWTVSGEEYAWAEQTIGGSPFPCVVFMHQSCEREHDGMPDWARMRGLFRWINRHKGPKVRLVVNGHHHTDGLRFIDGIAYLDLNSANYKYYAQRHQLYPKEYHRTHAGAGNVIAWNDPISAVITIGTDGYLKIEGENSKFFYGVSPEKAGFPPRDRPVTPNIQSIEMKVNVAFSAAAALAGKNADNPFRGSLEGMIVAAEQRSNEIVIVDGKQPGAPAFAWRWIPKNDLGIRREHVDRFRAPSDCKIVNGDMLLMVTSCGGFARIPLDTGRANCYGQIAGRSPHSITQLPWRDCIATASSVGNCVTLFDVSEHPMDPSKQWNCTYELKDAHGVEWDPERNCLWAIGITDLVRYAWRPDRRELVETDRIDFSDTCGMHGHDLSIDYDNSLLFTTADKLVKYVPETMTFSVLREQKQMKSFSRNRKYGDLAAIVREIWWTDRLLIRSGASDLVVGPYDGAKFYKARWMSR